MKQEQQQQQQQQGPGVKAEEMVEEEEGQGWEEVKAEPKQEEGLGGQQGLGQGGGTVVEMDDLEFEDI